MKFSHTKISQITVSDSHISRTIEISLVWLTMTRPLFVCPKVWFVDYLPTIAVKYVHTDSPLWHHYRYRYSYPKFQPKRRITENDVSATVCGLHQKITQNRQETCGIWDNCIYILLCPNREFLFASITTDFCLLSQPAPLGLTLERLHQSQIFFIF